MQTQRTETPYLNNWPLLTSPNEALDTRPHDQQYSLRDGGAIFLDRQLNEVVEAQVVSVKQRGHGAYLMTPPLAPRGMGWKQPLNFQSQIDGREAVIAPPIVQAVPSATLSTETETTQGIPPGVAYLNLRAPSVNEGLQYGPNGTLLPTR
jgi:hypothetical protein